MLLAVLLVGAQTGALAHAYTHDPGTSPDRGCASCLLATELHAACADSGAQEQQPRAHSPRRADAGTAAASTTNPPPRQRGPPAPL